MTNQKQIQPHVFQLEKLHYPNGYPDTLPLPADFLPQNDFFQPKEAVVDWYFSSPESVSSKTNLPLKDNQLMLKKWLSKEKFYYERDEDWRKIRGKKFDEVSKIRLKIEQVICERVKRKRKRKK